MLYGSWADVPEDERVDTEKPLQRVLMAGWHLLCTCASSWVMFGENGLARECRVLGLHIDEQKLIVGRCSSFPYIADTPGELTCWGLQKLDGGDTQVHLHWRLSAVLRTALHLRCFKSVSGDGWACCSR